MKVLNIIEKLANRVKEGQGCKEVSDFMFDACKQTDLTFKGKNKFNRDSFAVESTFGDDDSYNIYYWAEDIKDKRKSGTEFGAAENKRLFKEAKSNLPFFKGELGKTVAEKVLLENKVSLGVSKEDSNSFKRLYDLVVAGRQQASRRRDPAYGEPYRATNSDEVTERPAECFLSETLNLANYKAEDKKSIAPFVATSLVAWTLAANEEGGFNADTIKKISNIDNFIETYTLALINNPVTKISEKSVPKIRREAVALADQMVEQINAGLEYNKKSNEQIKNKNIKEVEQEIATTKQRITDMNKAIGRLEDLFRVGLIKHKDSSISGILDGRKGYKYTREFESDLVSSSFTKRTAQNEFGEDVTEIFKGKRNKEALSKASLLRRDKQILRALQNKLPKLEVKLQAAKDEKISVFTEGNINIKPSQFMHDIMLHSIFSNQASSIANSLNATEFDGKYLTDDGRYVSLFEDKDKQEEVLNGNIYESFVDGNYYEGIKRIQALYTGKTDKDGKITINSRFVDPEKRLKYAIRTIAYLQAAGIDELEGDDNTKLAEAFSDLYAENVTDNEDIVAEEYAKALEDIEIEKKLYEKSKTRNLRKKEKPALIDAFKDIMRPAGMDGKGIIKLINKDEEGKIVNLTYKIDKGLAKEIWASVNYTEEEKKNAEKDMSKDKYKVSKISKEISKDLYGARISKEIKALDKDLESAKLLASAIVLKHKDELKLEEVQEEETKPVVDTPEVEVVTIDVEAE